jgi:hypothetical protein
MAEPGFSVINVEETPDKIVGKRRGVKVDAAIQETANSLIEAFGHGLVPKGVFRFHTHEEADEWMLKMLARNRKRLI